MTQQTINPTTSSNHSHRLPKVGQIVQDAATAGVPFANVRPGLIFYSDSWDGPAIVLARNGDRLHCVAGSGMFTCQVDDLDPRETPRPESPLDAMADYIAAGFTIHPDTAPFVPARNHKLPILPTAEGEAWRRELFKVLDWAEDSDEPFTGADVLEEIRNNEHSVDTAWEKLAELKLFIVTLLGLNSKVAENFGDDFFIPVAGGITELKATAREAREALAKAMAPKPAAAAQKPGIRPLDVREFHKRIVELRCMFDAAIVAEDESGHPRIAVAIDGGVSPELAHVNDDGKLIEEALDDLQWRAEMLIGEVASDMVAAKAEGVPAKLKLQEAAADASRRGVCGGGSMMR